MLLTSTTAPNVPAREAAGHAIYLSGYGMATQLASSGIGVPPGVSWPRVAGMAEVFHASTLLLWVVSCGGEISPCYGFLSPSPHESHVQLHPGLGVAILVGGGCHVMPECAFLLQAADARGTLFLQQWGGGNCIGPMLWTV